MNAADKAALLEVAARLHEEANHLQDLACADDEEDVTRPSIRAARKLTREQVCEIRSSTLSTTQLALKFGVARGTIWAVRANASHRDVQP